MIPSDIRNFENLIPYLLILGLEKKSSAIGHQHYRLDNDKYNLNVLYSTVEYNKPEELSLVNFDDDTSLLGYEDTIAYLNTEFKYTFRKIKLNKLLNDTN